MELNSKKKMIPKMEKSDLEYAHRFSYVCGGGSKPMPGVPN
jgi:hypothetical protein